MQFKFDASFFKRLGFFLFGLALGTFLLGRFYDKKNASFDYGPNARTLKSIRNKQFFVYSDEVKEIMKLHNIDTTAVKNLLFFGDVKFNKRNRGKAPCHTYLIEPTKKTAAISISVKRCDSVATVLDLKVLY